MSDNDSGSSNGDGTEQRPIKILTREKSPDNSKELGTKASEQDSSDVKPQTDKKEAETKILKPRPLEAEGGAKSESNGTTSPKAKSKSSAKSKKAEDKDKKNGEIPLICVYWHEVLTWCLSTCILSCLICLEYLNFRLCDFVCFNHCSGLYESVRRD